MFPNISLGSMPRGKIVIKLADIQQLYIIFKQRRAISLKEMTIF